MRIANRQRTVLVDISPAPSAELIGQPRQAESGQLTQSECHPATSYQTAAAWPWLALLLAISIPASTYPWRPLRDGQSARQRYRVARTITVIAGPSSTA